MLTQSEQIDAERNRQTLVAVLFSLAVTTAFFLNFKLVYPFHWYGAALIAATAFYQWDVIKKDFQHRLVMVTFKTQIHPLFIFQRSPDDKDVFSRRKYATYMLAESENNHRVKVFTHVFGDVMVFVDTVAPDGSITTERHFVKGATPATQTWYEYQTFCIQLEAEKVNEFIAKRRVDPTGDDWFNVHHFNQKT